MYCPKIDLNLQPDIILGRSGPCRPERWLSSHALYGALRRPRQRKMDGGSGAGSLLPRQCHAPTVGRRELLVRGAGANRNWRLGRVHGAGGQFVNYSVVPAGRARCGDWNNYRRPTDW